MSGFRLVILESPYAAGDRAANTAYARLAMLDALARGEAPLASHLLYTQVTDDDVPHERALGIDAGLAWGRAADATVVYTDRGISDGMRLGIARAEAEGRRVEYRCLPNYVVRRCAALSDAQGETSRDTQAATIAAQRVACAVADGSQQGEGGSNLYDRGA